MGNQAQRKEVAKIETSKLYEEFNTLDINKDGKLGRDEVAKAFSSIFGDDEKKGSEIGDAIFEIVDADGDGKICFHEYVKKRGNKYVREKKMKNLLKNPDEKCSMM